MIGTWRAGRRRAAVERRLGEVWADVLGVPEVAPDDDFFELGGSSLHAMRIVATVEELYATELSVRALLDAPTVAGMAGAVVDATAAGR